MKQESRRLSDESVFGKEREFVEYLRCVVERITYQNAENGYTLTMFLVHLMFVQEVLQQQECFVLSVQR